MTDYGEKYEQSNQEAAYLRQQSPEEMKAFSGLLKTTMREGTLDVKTKEMIALGIAIADRCEGCIMAHVRNNLKNGVTLEQLAEVVDVAILMGGGPSTVYGAKALAFAKYLQEQEQ
ncbi:MAG: carboxymuconolactone decarboxylase family protein [Bombilactobacillus mellis]|nr:carboxymuconolactone decarboxylase family protein [Bombilactobacillus mellis]